VSVFQDVEYEDFSHAANVYLAADC